MQRRDFIRGITGLATTATTLPLGARGQQAERTRRIGVLSPGGPELPDPTFNKLNTFLQGLHELGFTEGQNLTIERQYASSDRLHELAAELVKRKPDTIVAFSTTDGASLPDLARQSAKYVAKIIKGAKPAKLPVEQPIKLELVVDLKTAKALDLTIPPTLLARVDEVIE